MKTKGAAKTKAPGSKKAFNTRISLRAKKANRRSVDSHVQREDVGWAITIPNHESRTNTPAYVVAWKVMNNVVKEIKDFFLGAKGPYQDHHGGGLWVKDHDGKDTSIIDALILQPLS